MTITEAADYLRPIMENATLPRYQEALRLAVEALEERAEGPTLMGAGTLDRSRWEGCEYCLEDKGIVTFEVPDEIEIPEDVVKFGWVEEPQYCPNCGRPLTEEAWTELERRINGGQA